MDLLLAHAYFMSEDAQELVVRRPYPPLGLLYVSSHLKAKGFDVSVFDGTFSSAAAFVALLDRERPAVVGIYCNLMTKRGVLRLAAECARRGILTIVGGPEPPHYAEEYLGRGIDFVVVGEGEKTLEELLPRLIANRDSRDLAGVPGLVYRDAAGALVRTRPRPLIASLDDQPWPDRESVTMERYLRVWKEAHGVGAISLVTSRGCPYTCRWCSRSVFGETHRRRSVGGVADEVASVVARYAPDMLWYVDDVFTIHPGWLRSFADEMERRSLRVPFECISRADRIDDGVVRDLVRLGCRRLWIGSESGSQRVLDAMDRRVTVEQVRSATRRLQSAGIEVGMFMMMGFHGEDESDLRKTLEHLKAASPDAFLTTVAYPIKGTPYHEDVAPLIRRAAAWDETTDRDLAVAGRPSRRYYDFARRWLTGEWERQKHWRGGRYLAAARAAARAAHGRIGMTITRGEREAV